LHLCHNGLDQYPAGKRNSLDQLACRLKRLGSATGRADVLPIQLLPPNASLCAQPKVYIVRDPYCEKGSAPSIAQRRQLVKNPFLLWYERFGTTPAEVFDPATLKSLCLSLFCEARFAGLSPWFALFAVVVVVVYILGSCAKLSASLHPVPIPDCLYAV
jgi:hypothetical protein